MKGEIKGVIYYRHLGLYRTPEGYRQTLVHAVIKDRSNKGFECVRVYIRPDSEVPDYFVAHIGTSESEAKNFCEKDKEWLALHEFGMELQLKQVITILKMGDNS